MSRLENGKQSFRFKILLSIAAALDISFQKLIKQVDFNSEQALGA